ADTAVFNAALMDLGFGPHKRFGVFVVGFDKCIDVLAKLGDRVERGTVQGFSFQDREPNSTWLSDEARVGVKWKCTLGFRLSQWSFLGLWVLRLSRMTWMAVSP